MQKQTSPTFNRDSSPSQCTLTFNFKSNDFLVAPKTSQVFKTESTSEWPSFSQASTAVTSPSSIVGEHTEPTSPTTFT